MFRCLFQWLGLIALVASAALSAAQEPTAQELPDDPNEGTDESAEQIAAEPPAPVVDQSQTELEDYEASEQISEDLSVSFPVDI